MGGRAAKTKAAAALLVALLLVLAASHAADAAADAGRHVRAGDALLLGEQLSGLERSH